MAESVLSKVQYKLSPSRKILIHTAVFVSVSIVLVVQIALLLLSTKLIQLDDLYLLLTLGLFSVII